MGRTTSIDQNMQITRSLIREKAMIKTIFIATKRVVTEDTAPTERRRIKGIRKKNLKQILLRKIMNLQMH